MPLVTLLLTLVLALAPARSARAFEDPEQREPKADAPALQVFAWKAKAGDLRYTWVLPKGYDGKTPRNLSVILHGTGLDYRWGHWNNKPGIFRPDDIVVSVDGTSPDKETRLFLGEDKDAKLFKQYLDELRTVFAVDRVFLYGHSQGGFFVVYFAGEFPASVSGVVAHASGAWNWSKMPKELKKVAISFMHGSSDPVVPYGQSPGSRDAYLEKGFALTHLRRLPYYNHWPNAVRATEELYWCQGMTSSDPKEALACAVEMLREKPADEYQWTTAVGYSGARDVLRRLEGKGPAPLAAVAEETLAEAREWIAKIDAAADEQVKELKSNLPKKGALALDGKDWLGHLLPLREDFRGIDAVEKLFSELGFEKLVETQQKAAKPLYDAWYDFKNETKCTEAVLETIGKCFLVDGLPGELRAKMKEWEGKKLKLSPAATKKLGDWENYTKGLDGGWKKYEALWKKWKGPEKPKR